MKTHVTNTVRAFVASAAQCVAFFIETSSADPGPCSRGQQSWPLYFCPSRHFRKSSESVAVSTERRRSARMFSQEVGAHNPTASGTSLVACSRAHPVPVMCVGLPLCARHSASLPCWQSPADCQRPCTSSSALYRHDDATSAVDATLYHRGPRISSGRSSSLEQSAACDESRQLTAAVSARDKSTSLSPVVSGLTRDLLSTVLHLLA